MSKTNPDGTVSFAYTADGKISSVTDSTGTTMFTYDLMVGLTRVDYPDGNYVSYSYDNACRLTSVTTPFGTTAYEYDLLDRLTRVVDRNGYATVYEYDTNGNRTAVHYANGFTTTYDYDLLNRLIRQETVDIDGDIVVRYIYTLGVAGERKSVTELDRTVEYTYDSLYRLTSETITEGEKNTVYTYAYDNVSNRILKNENGSATEYVYNALNQLVSDSETTYKYDLNGNLICVIGSAQSALYEYNSENKLVKATVQNGVLVTEESYTYDYQGNRTSKSTHKSNGEFEYTKYLNDNSSLTNVLAEIDENGTAKCVYTIGADLVSQERDGRTSFYLYDGHGSVVGLANESGVVTDTYAYDAFGNLLKSTGSTKNCYRYCGEQFDETTGLYYLRARYMDTSTGRFISQDSYAGSISDPTSLHKYLYANSNPVTYSDPGGYFIQYVFGAISNGIAWAAESRYNMAIVALGMMAISDLLCVLTTGHSYMLTLTEFIASCVTDIASGDMTSPSIGATYRNEITKDSDDSKSKSKPYAHRLPNNIPKGRIYQEAFVMSSDDFLHRSYVKMTFMEAIAAFAVSINLNKVITMASRFSMSKDKADKAKQKCGSHIWGIYTHNEKNAAALAAVFGSDLRHDCHGNGQLFHYHDGGHNAHIWYGNPS